MSIPTLEPQSVLTNITLLAARTLVALASLALLSCHAGPEAFLHDLHFIQSEEGILVLENDREVFFYQREPKSLNGRVLRAHYIHPLYDLDGTLLTEDFPQDHIHHRGIFWAWHQIIDAEGHHAGDSWLCRDFSWDVHHVNAEKTDRGLSLSTHVIWRSPLLVDEDGEIRDLFQERTRIDIYPSSSERQFFDFEIRLEALEQGLQLGGSNDNKGYGGFCTRLKLPPDALFQDAEGPVEPTRLASRKSPWMSISGALSPSDPEARSGVAILSHPTSIDHSPPWILRRQRAMQNAVFPGRDCITLDRGDELVFRYRLILHRGPANPQHVQSWFQAFTQHSFEGLR